MKILFIGNSYTYYHNMTNKLQTLCNENGIDAEISELTAGGYSLAHFASENNEKGIELRKLISENKYDIIVLQEQSVIPAAEPQKLMNNAEKLAKVLECTGAKLVFYETWARRDGEETLIKNSWTHEEMQEKLRTSYENAAKALNAGLCRAGEVFSKAYRNGVGDAMYEADGSHPSDVGSKLIAECFFDCLFG